MAPRQPNAAMVLYCTCWCGVCRRWADEDDEDPVDRVGPDDDDDDDDGDEVGSKEADVMATCIIHGPLASITSSPGLTSTSG